MFVASSAARTKGLRLSVRGVGRVVVTLVYFFTATNLLGSYFGCHAHCLEHDHGSIFHHRDAGKAVDAAAAHQMSKSQGADETAVTCADTSQKVGHIGVQNWDNYLPSEQSQLALAVGRDVPEADGWQPVVASADPPDTIPI